MIVIVDYGMGNLGSIRNMCKKVKADAMISSDIADIERADKLILPGVGAFDNGMKNLNEMGLIPVLNHKVLEEKTPILGPCLGMQLFTERSEEGGLPGLGWIEADTVKFQFNGSQPTLKVPHMGWNFTQLAQAHSIWQGLEEEETRFYFVHSYHVVCRNNDNVLATTNYGQNFTSVVIKDNIIGTQFHPEKSHKFGMRLLKNFAENFQVV